MSSESRKLWDKFEEVHSLKLVHNLRHSYTHKSGKHVSTHMIDRFYTNHDEADQLLYTPHASTLFPKDNPSDHNPVSLRFASTQDSRGKINNIPEWFITEPTYQNRVRLTFHSKDMSDLDPFQVAQKARRIGQDVAKKMLKKERFHTTHPPQKLAVASQALKELVSQTPRQKEIDRLTRLDPSMPLLNTQDIPSSIRTARKRIASLWMESLPLRASITL